MKALPLAALLALGLMTAADAVERPNVIYFMSDELGYYELSHMGHPHIQTPNIDRMAAEGMRFTQCLAGSSLCAPTRCCLMTGKHSGHTSVRLNGGGTPLRAGEETIASALRSAGYATGGFGKWGCGGRGSTGVPEQHGFDIFLGYYDQVHAHSYYPPYLVLNSEEVPLAGNHGRSEGETFSHYVIFDAALDFIREHKDEPFFCYLPVTPPPGIFDIPNDDPAWQLYKDKDWPEEARRYAAMVTMVDRNVGEVQALLRELGLDETTVMFFSGDNGGNDYFKSPQIPRGFHGPNVNPREAGQVDEFRGHKGLLYEGGLRVPFIARWPGRIAPGTVVDHLCYFPDVLPTICELTGAEAPADIDGVSFAPTLLHGGNGKPAPGQQQHEYLYWELNGQTAVRQENWKAVQPAKGRKPQPWELYDLAQDPGEERNLAQEKPDVLARLQRFAEQAHEPVREGTFASTEMHERDRQAKFGFDDNGKSNRRGGGR
jgi:arylsulfatase A-like enzyme